MAEQQPQKAAPAKATSAGTKEVATGQTEKLDPSEVKDPRDVSPRVSANLSGRRLRAIPYKGGTTIEVRRADFKRKGIDHKTVSWDFRKDRATLEVGKDISEEAAEMLTKEFPTSFEYMSDRTAEDAPADEASE